MHIYIFICILGARRGGGGLCRVQDALCRMQRAHVRGMQGAGYVDAGCMPSRACSRMQNIYVGRVYSMYGI